MSLIQALAIMTERLNSTGLDLRIKLAGAPNLLCRSAELLRHDVREVIRHPQQ
jgi:hypothetical protein